MWDVYNQMEANRSTSIITYNVPQGRFNLKALEESNYIINYTNPKLIFLKFVSYIKNGILSPQKGTQK